MTPSEITDLLKRIDGPSREMDWAIQCVFFSNETFMPFNHMPTEWMTNISGKMYPVTRAGRSASSGDRYCPLYTSFVDRAIMLAELAFTDANCWSFDKTKGGIEASIQRNDVKGGHWASFGEHKTSPAIAMCLAVLNRKKTQEEQQ